MNDVQRNFLTAGIVCAASAALIGGMAMRERIDERLAGLTASARLAPGLRADSSKNVDIPEERYFYDLMVLLKREYVEPIPSELPLAVGSVKGMVSSLDDEHSIYMSKPVFQAFVKSLEGEFEGVGASFILERIPSKVKKPYRSTLDLLERVPVVKVAYVVPGSPAAKAGIVSGDEVESIEGRWVVNPHFAQKYRIVSDQVSKKQLPESELTQMQAQLRENLKSSLMPMRAFEKLTTGTSGALRLTWRHGGEIRKGIVEKAPSAMEVNSLSGEVFRPAFVKGAANELRKALESQPSLVIDLRGLRQGDLQVMRDCLALLGPAGSYGSIVREAGKAEPFGIAKGAPTAAKPKLLVDSTTAGVAEAFALALKSKNLATLEGGPMAGDPSIIERTSLPDGSGFTLRVGRYQPEGKS